MKIYCIQLDNDCGELWLDENKQPLSWIHCNDGSFSSYHEFIFDYLKVNFVKIDFPKLSDEDWDSLLEADCMESVYDILKPHFNKILKNK